MPAPDSVKSFISFLPKVLSFNCVYVFVGAQKFLPCLRHWVKAVFIFSFLRNCWVTVSFMTSRPSLSCYWSLSFNLVIPCDWSHSAFWAALKLLSDCPTLGFPDCIGRGGLLSALQLVDWSISEPRAAHCEAVISLPFMGMGKSLRVRWVSCTCCVTAWDWTQPST